MKTALLLTLFAVALSTITSSSSHAAAARTETADELAIKTVIAQLAKQDLKFVTAQVPKVCGTDKPGTLVVVKTQVKPGVLQTVKVYGVTEKGIFFGGSEVHDCSVEK